VKRENDIIVTKRFTRLERLEEPKMFKHQMRKIRDPPYDLFAANYSRTKINAFWTNTKKMTYRGYKVLNKTNGPFNSTFYKLYINFYNRYRLVRFQTGLAVFPNFTAQMFWINDGYRGPRRTRYEPINDTSPEAEKLVGYTKYNIERNKWFTFVNPEFQKTTYISLAKFPLLNIYTPRWKYYRAGLLYSAPVQNRTVNYTINVILRQNISSGYFYFSSIGMKRMRTPKRIKRVKLGKKVRASPLDEFAFNFSIKKINAFFYNTRRMTIRGQRITSKTKGPLNSTFYKIEISFFNRKRIRKYTTGSYIFPNYTGQIYWINDGWIGPRRTAYQDMNSSSEEGQAILEFAKKRLEQNKWFELPPAGFVNVTSLSCVKSNITRRPNYFKLRMIYNYSLNEVVGYYNITTILIKWPTSAFYSFSQIGMRKIRPSKKIRIIRRPPGPHKKKPKLGATPLEEFAMNYSLQRIRDFFPNTRPMTVRNKIITNTSQGPYNSTFFQVTVSFYNRQRILQFRTGLYAFPNFTGQMYWIRDGYRGPRWTTYVDLSQSSEQGQTILNFAINNIESKKWFALRPAFYVNCTLLQVSTSFGRRPDYYRMRLFYNYTRDNGTTGSYNMSVTLVKFRTSSVYRFSYIGMRRPRRTTIRRVKKNMKIAIIKKITKKIRASPLEEFAMNYSLQRIRDFFPNTRPMTVRNKMITNTSQGPYNSTFYQVTINFYNRARILRFTTGLYAFPNYTGQMYWIRDGYRGPRWTTYVDLNQSSEQGQEILNYTIRTLEFKKWFSIRPASFVNCTLLQVSKSTGRRPDYFRMRMMYNYTRYNATEAFYNMSVTLVKFSYSKYYRFSYIGMRRPRRPRPRLVKIPLIRKPTRYANPLKLPKTSMKMKKLRASPLDEFAMNYSVKRIRDFFPNTRPMTLRNKMITNSSRGPYNSTFYQITVNFYNRARILRFRTGLYAFPNYTGQMYWIQDGYRGPRWTTYVDLNQSSEQGQEILNYTIRTLEYKKWFSIRPASFVNCTLLQVSNSTGRRPDYFRLRMWYNYTRYNATEAFYNMSVTLVKFPTSKYYRFSYIGMRRPRRPRPRFYK